MKETKKRICLDCLFCKVSAKSTANKRLCYCGKMGKKVLHREGYWQTKKACQEFDDMGA